MFVNHVLAVSEVCMGLIEAERRGELDVIEFEAEPLCWRDYVGLGGERLVLKPDAFTVVGVGEEEQHSFIEVDRATEGMNTVRRKADAFRAYALSSIEQQRRGVFPKVVLLTTDEQRAGRISDVVHRLPDGKELFAVSVFTDAIKLLTGETP